MKRFESFTHIIIRILVLQVKLEYNLSLIDEKCYFGNTRCHYNGRRFDESDKEEESDDAFESLSPNQVLELKNTEMKHNPDDDDSEFDDDTNDNDDVEECDDENMIVLLSGDEDGSSTSQSESEDDDPDPEMGDD